MNPVKKSYTNDKLSRFHKAKRAELSSLSQREKDLKEKRLELLREAEELCHQIAETKTAYGALYNTGSPLFGLPVEVTSSIFQYAIIEDHTDIRSQRAFDEDSDDDDISGLEFDLQQTSIAENGRNSALLMEVVVSHVCTYWRSVALNTTTLWTNFHCHTYDRSALGSSIDRLEAYLERSGCRTLDLKLDFCGAAVNLDKSDDRPEMLSKIIPHTARWRRVSILADSNTSFLDILDEVETLSAPNLEHITVRGNCSTKSQDTESLMFKAGVPKLSSVTTDSLSIALLPPLSNITSLRIERHGMDHRTISPECLLSILHIPNLTNLSLIGARQWPTLPENLHTIDMPKLKYLLFTEDVNMCQAFPFLRAPVLETLIIRGYFPWTLPTDDYFFPSLRTLVMGNSPTEPAVDFLPISKYTSRVTHLTFSAVQSLQNTELFHGYWPDLRFVCLNILRSYDIYDYSSFITAHINPRLTLRVSKHLVSSWWRETPYDLQDLQQVCFVEAVTDENMHTFLHPAWPPGELNVDDLVEEDDYFLSEVHHKSREWYK